MQYERAPGPGLYQYTRSEQHIAFLAFFKLQGFQYVDVENSFMIPYTCVPLLGKGFLSPFKPYFLMET